MSFSKSKMAAMPPFWIYSSKVKTRREHIYCLNATTCKFGENRSSRSGDIEDFSKSNMAAVPPFWI